MMRKSWLAAFLAVFLLSAATVRADDADDEYGDSEKAHLIVHKYIENKDETLAYPLVVQGRNVTVTVLIQNQGTSTANDVQLRDVLPANAEVVDGSLTATFKKIAVGSQVKHTYVIKFVAGGSMEAIFLDEATVSYKADAESGSTTGLSTKAGIFVLTPTQQITRYALIAGTYASLGICRTPAQWRNMGIFIAIVGGLLGANWSVKQFSTTKANTRRKKALQELEKND